MVSRRLLLGFSILCMSAALGRTAMGQTAPARPPVIDMHIHESTLTPKAVANLDSFNIRHVFISATSTEARNWTGKDANRFLVAMMFPCDKGLAPFSGARCFETPTDFPDTAWLRGELKAGRMRGFGELEPAFLGMALNDPRMEPYWRLAEEFDIPVGIHMGPAPPGIAYASSSMRFKSPLYRMAMTDPTLLEDVMLRHQKLRLFVMHAGFPRLEAMLALLQAHPNVYVDVAVLSAPSVVPRAAYYKFLSALVEAGFAKRIMYGSDGANEQARGIDAILKADFLSEEQRNDILCNNAMRFLRLRKEVCQP